MVKPEWGAKHGCPKCGTRFYDLGKDDPATCIDCGYAWTPDPVLKSKQPVPYEEIQKKEARLSPMAIWPTRIWTSTMTAIRPTTTLILAATRIWVCPATTMVSPTTFEGVVCFRRMPGVRNKT